MASAPIRVDITSSMTHNVTFVECRACKTTWQSVPPTPGLLHKYVDRCHVCEAKRVH